MDDSHFNSSYFWSPVPTVQGQVEATLLLELSWNTHGIVEYAMGKDSLELIITLTVYGNTLNIVLHQTMIWPWTCFFLITPSNNLRLFGEVGLTSHKSYLTVSAWWGEGWLDHTITPVPLLSHLLNPSLFLCFHLLFASHHAFVLSSLPLPSSPSPVFSRNGSNPSLTPTFHSPHPALWHLLPASLLSFPFLFHPSCFINVTLI